jgi:hypothetical protein
MAAVDDIDIAGATSMREVADTISALLSTSVSTLPDGRPYLRVDECTQVTMYPDDDYPGRWIAEVYHAGEVVDRQSLARRIYDYLTEHTDWDLTLDSDDADDVVASRIKTRSPRSAS